MATVTYNGGHAAVDLYDPETGREIASDVEQGKSVEVPEHVAEALADREDWTVEKPSKPAGKSNGSGKSASTKEAK